MAAGVRAGRRRRIPDQRARGQGDGRLHRRPSQHRRGDQLSHARGRDPAADGHRERRRHDPRGPVVDQTLQRHRHAAQRLPGRQHLARVQVPPEAGHQRHAGLGLRASRRAVLGRRDLGAEPRGRHSRIQVHRLVSRSPGRGRPEAAEVERRSHRRARPRRLDAVRPSAARPGRDRWLGQDELLAQPAARAARARGRPLPEVDDADRAVAAEARAVVHRGRVARRRDVARAARRGERRVVAGLRDEARAATQDRARRALRDRAARRRPARSRWSAASAASKGRSSKAMHRRRRCSRSSPIRT